MELQHQRQSQDARGHAAPPIGQAVELRKHGIVKQQPSLAGEKAVKTIGPHEIQVLPVGRGEAALRMQTKHALL